MAPRMALTPFLFWLLTVTTTCKHLGHRATDDAAVKASPTGSGNLGCRNGGSPFTSASELVGFALDGKNGAFSIEQVLARLRVKAPAFMRNHTFVYESLSEQGASYQFPRALVFGEDGKFILSFNGSPDQKGYYDLELAQFCDETAEIELSRLSFASSGDRLPEFSGVNPRTCLECHSSRPKPWGKVKYIWSNYPSWPGVYGSQDDRIEGKQVHREEVDNWQRFSMGNLQDRALRYHHLYGIEDDFVPEPSFDLGRPYSERPNLRLNKLLNRLSARSIAKDLEAMPFITEYVPLLLWANQRICRLVDDDVPLPVVVDHLRQLVSRNGSSAFEQHIRSVRYSGHEQAAAEGDSSFQHVLRIKQTDFPKLVEEFGIGRDRWDLEFREGLDGFRDGTDRSTESLVMDLLYRKYFRGSSKEIDKRYYPYEAWLIKDDNPRYYRIFNELGVEFSIGEEPSVCKGLGDSVRELLVGTLPNDMNIPIVGLQAERKLHPWEMKPALRTWPAELASCVNCHDTGAKKEIGPQIPFRDRNAARAYFRDGAARGDLRVEYFLEPPDDVQIPWRVRMPYGRAELADEARRVILDYLE